MSKVPGAQSSLDARNCDASISTPPISTPPISTPPISTPPILAGSSGIVSIHDTDPGFVLKDMKYGRTDAAFVASNLSTTAKPASKWNTKYIGVLGPILES